MSHPIPGHAYGENERNDEFKKKKKNIAKKMSPLGKLKAMVSDRPTTIAGHLDWFKKHGVPR